MKTTIKRFAIVSLLAGCPFFMAPAMAQQFTMKLSTPTINDVSHEYYKRLKAGIEQRAGGKIKVEIYPANQLGQIPATVEGVALGTIEATSVANGFYISLEPRFQVLDAPGLFPLQERRHRDQQTKHQQDHDLGHGQAEHQASLVR